MSYYRCEAITHQIIAPSRLFKYKCCVIVFSLVMIYQLLMLLYIPLYKGVLRLLVCVLTCHLVQCRQSFVIGVTVYILVIKIHHDNAFVFFL